MGVDALEATVSPCLPSLAVVATRRLESGQSICPRGDPQWGLVHSVVWPDDGRDGSGSAFGRAVVDAASVCRGLGGEVADEGGLPPRAGRYRARLCRNRHGVRGAGHLAAVATSTDGDRPDRLPHSRTVRGLMGERVATRGTEP